MKYVLFDLDGTLLPMDQDEFIKGYFKLLAKKLVPYGYDPKTLIDAVWHGTSAMVKNDGHCSNEDAFWKDFKKIYGERALRDRAVFEEFYAVEFQQARVFCGFDERAAEVIRFLKENGIKTVLATNPLFPAIATESRIRWAGLAPEDFELYTTYENIGYCKPNLKYYEEILRRIHVRSEECLMVGNDVREDMVAEQLGMKVFLLTDHLINRKNADISRYPHGGFDELTAYLREQLS